MESAACPGPAQCPPPAQPPASEHQPTAIFSEVQLCVDNVDVKADIYFANRPLAHAEDALRVYKLCHVCS